MSDTEYWGLFLRNPRTPLATKGTLSPVSFEFSTPGHGEVRTGGRNKQRASSKGTITGERTKGQARVIRTVFTKIKKLKVTRKGKKEKNAPHITLH